MSGGSYDYAYLRVEELADEIELRAGDDPRRVAFAHLLHKCADAAKAIEWVDSFDRAQGSEHEAIDAVVSRSDSLAAAKAGVLRAIEKAEAMVQSLDGEDVKVAPRGPEGPQDQNNPTQDPKEG